MTEQTVSPLCPDSGLSVLVETIGVDTARGMHDIAALLNQHPEDPRLHFLKGALLAGNRDYANARVAMRRAVDIAPNYAVARFQLGFLLLTMGEPFAAQEAWGPLHGLPANNYLYLFAKGLCHLIRNEFEDATARLQDGIARNTENPAVNQDIVRIIEQIRNRPDAGGHEDAPVSLVGSLLQQSAIRPSGR
jgi:Flp pilus assembly protein TadD